MADSFKEVYRVAHELFRQDPDWVTFFREVLGLEGVVHQACQTPDERAAFERSKEYAEIQGMLAKLRQRNGEDTKSTESDRVITIRMPRSLHELLRAEAYERRTSMNKLCIAKLLQPVDDALISS